MVYMNQLIFIFIDFEMPNQNEISKMQEQLFADLDGEDGLDKAFETMHALRGK